MKLFGKKRKVKSKNINCNKKLTDTECKESLNHKCCEYNEGMEIGMRLAVHTAWLSHDNGTTKKEFEELINFIDEDCKRLLSTENYCSYTLGFLTYMKKYLLSKFTEENAPDTDPNYVVQETKLQKVCSELSKIPFSETPADKFMI